MNIKPLGTRVLLKPIPKEQKSIIDQPDPREKVWNRAEVVSIGEKVQHVKEGMRVIFSPLHFDEVDSDLYIIEEEDIWGIES